MNKMSIWKNLQSNRKRLWKEHSDVCKEWIVKKKNENKAEWLHAECLIAQWLNTEWLNAEWLYV